MGSSFIYVSRMVSKKISKKNPNGNICSCGRSLNFSSLLVSFVCNQVESEGVAHSAGWCSWGWINRLLPDYELLTYPTMDKMPTRILMMMTVARMSRNSNTSLLPLRILREKIKIYIYKIFSVVWLTLLAWPDPWPDPQHHCECPSGSSDIIIFLPWLARLPVWHWDCWPDH